MAQDALDRIAESDALDRLTVESSESESNPTFGSEVKNQLSSTARGALATFSRPERVFSALWGGIKTPFQTFFDKDLPLEERLPLSILSAMGADPYRVKQLHDEGHQGAAIAAALTLPAVNAGLAATIKKIAGSSLPSEAKRTAKLTAATGPGGAIEVPAAYKKAMGEISATIEKSGVDPSTLTVKDLLKAVRDTNSRLEQQFQSALLPIAHQETVPASVSSAIRAKITSNLSQTAEGQRLANYLKQRAVEFEKPWTYEQLNQERMRLFDMRTGLSKESLAARSNAEMMADRAAEDALRDLVYSAVDQGDRKTLPVFGPQQPRNPWIRPSESATPTRASGPSSTTLVVRGRELHSPLASAPPSRFSEPFRVSSRPSYSVPPKAHSVSTDIPMVQSGTETTPPAYPAGTFAKLKEVQSHLYDLSDLLQKRVADLSNRSAIKKGTPLLQREGLSTYGTSTGKPGLSVHRLQDFFRDPQKVAGQRVQEAFSPSPYISKKGGAVLTWLFGRGPETEEEREEYTPSPRGTLRAP